DFGLTAQAACPSAVSLAWSAQFLAAGCGDGAVRIYEHSKDFLLAKELRDTNQMINSMVLFGQILAAGGDDSKIRIYDVSQ
ncbi:unnamed protein product, partial [Symbiodinium pilosum]